MKQIAYRRPKSQAVEIKGVFWGILLALTLVGYSVWASLNIYSNRQYTAVGKAVQCVERPSYEYFRFCNGLVDGKACTLANRTRMMDWYGPVDEACAQFEPHRTFVFTINTERT